MKSVSSTIAVIMALVFSTAVQGKIFCKAAPPRCAYGQKYWRGCDVNLCQFGACPGKTRPHCCFTDKPGKYDDYCT
ncbi:hypothetical protein E6O75_ATG09555 [Venturia nashicola]|uniref:Uncharacterized protein n=1 Tax=Venturia nashicola TaxID=86259 RepID=A0A4Z1NLM0_9PEZI|nr:hypothetical protein E6O75_ATG09555 [Venturia nashicola]